MTNLAKPIFTRALVAALALALSCAGVVAGALPRSALGLIVDACAADDMILSLPEPCLKVVRAADPNRSYVVLREPFSRERTILSPIASIAGIEDPRLVLPDAPNFFAMAWQERGAVIGATKGSVGWRQMALAINSEQSRTQDRLHVHIACVKSEVAEALAREAATITTGQFHQIRLGPSNHPYWAMRLAAESLAGHNPIRLVAEGVPEAAAHMGSMTIAVVGEKAGDGARGFIILAARSDPAKGFAAEAERLLDPKCHT